MSEYIPDTRPGSGAATGLLRRIVPVLLLGLVLFRVGVIFADYATSDDDTAPAVSTESTTTVEPGSEEDAGPGETPVTGEDIADPVGDVRYVVVTIPGLNFRAEPKANAEVMRTLPKDTKLRLLAEQNGWYQVRDDDDVTGWVSSSPDYVEVVDE